MAVTPTSSISIANRAQFAPELVTALPGPLARKMIQQDERLISPSYTRGYPLAVKSGRGSWIEDVDGNQVPRLHRWHRGQLDRPLSSRSGESHPGPVRRLIHMSGTDFYYEQMPALAERLSAIAPMPGPHRVYYGNSGAEAVECALKLARYHTGRQHIISFFGSFHGRTMGALSLTGSKIQQKRRFAPFVPGITHILYPYAYRGLQRCSAYRGGARTCMRALHRREALQDNASSGRGCRNHSGTDSGRRRLRRGTRHLLAGDPPHLRSARHSAHRRRGPVRVGRTGKWWAIEHSGVQPDIVCIAKGIASGMPLGICMARAEIMDWVPGSHASTFGGNPISIAAALVTIDHPNARACRMPPALAPRCSLASRTG
jgi:4-aminobutyrate aminotransferase